MTGKRADWDAGRSPMDSLPCGVSRSACDDDRCRLMRKNFGRCRCTSPRSFSDRRRLELARIMSSPPCTACTRGPPCMRAC
eukprot:363901-Chlamydomonas_euryale.AAC.4